MHGNASGKIGLMALAILLLLTLATPVAALEPQGDQPAERGEPSAQEDGQAESGRAEEPQTMQPAPKVDPRGTESQGSESRSDNPRAETPQADNPRAESPRPGGPGMPHKQPPALTAKQQKELARLYKNLYGTQKKLIGKYAEFGVITQEQAAMWLNRLEARYEKLKENGFMPVWRKCDKKRLPQ